MPHYHRKKYPNRRQTNRVNYKGQLRISIQEGITFIEQIKNISQKGICLSHNGKYNFALYEKLHFEIILSDTKKELNIQGVASVIRLIPFEEIGLKISSIDSENLIKLNHFIENQT